MGLESKIKNALGEEVDAAKQAMNNLDQDNFESMLFESFVKEKDSLLRYIHQLVRFAAKINDIDTVDFLEETKEELAITSDKDAYL